MVVDRKHVVFNIIADATERNLFLLLQLLTARMLSLLTESRLLLLLLLLVLLLTARVLLLLIKSGLLFTLSKLKFTVISIGRLSSFPHRACSGRAVPSAESAPNGLYIHFLGQHVFDTMRSVTGTHW